MNTSHTIETYGGVIIVTVAGGTGSLASTGLKTGDRQEWDSAVDGLESLVLALALAGYDISDPKFVRAVDSALESMENHLQ